MRAVDAPGECWLYSRGHRLQSHQTEWILSDCERGFFFQINQLIPLCFNRTSIFYLSDPTTKLSFNSTTTTRERKKCFQLEKKIKETKKKNSRHEKRNVSKRKEISPVEAKRRASSPRTLKLLSSGSITIGRCLARPCVRRFVAPSHPASRFRVGLATYSCGSAPSTSDKQRETRWRQQRLERKREERRRSVSRLLFPLDRIGGTWRARMRPFTPRTHAMKHRLQREFFFFPHDPAPRISRVCGEGGGERFPSNSFRDSCNGSPQLFCAGGTHGLEAVRISSFLCANCAALHFRTLRDKRLQVF